MSGVNAAQGGEDDLLRRAREGDDPAFRELADTYRAELQLHCYRIVGSVQDAEDLVQETLLAAWRGLDRFEGRAGLRTWLYRIATNRCLNALRDRGRRPQTSPVPPGTPEPPAPTRMGEPLWLEPYPDTLLDGVDLPESRYERQEAIGLAFTAGLQRLPPRQRAALVLRDALGFSARETAAILETTETAANRLLARAREGLPPLERTDAPLPRSPEEQHLVERFVHAFESGDIAGVLALLTEDARLTMPPAPLEYEGPAAIGRFLSTVPAGGRLDQFRLVPTRANGQPAFGCYLRDPHTPIGHAYGLMVLTLSGDHIAAVTGFADTSVFRAFGLARTIPID
jgi:RNA polymerase sigma-70 factor (TIGR02960 family)